MIIREQQLITIIEIDSLEIIFKLPPLPHNSAFRCSFLFIIDFSIHNKQARKIDSPITQRNDTTSIYMTNRILIKNVILLITYSTAKVLVKVEGILQIIMSAPLRQITSSGQGIYHSLLGDILMV